MGLTLFGYIFRDLLKVFGLAAFVIAGIMSFAGLLRPLTERGLAADQAVTILAWLLPAMTTYSLPVAALFATTFVYGRLAADNEITAIRAAGVPTGIASITGTIGIAFPALMLGIGASFVSLVLLCFVVPAANLQVERVIYSNVARLAANEVNRSKRLLLSGTGSNITLNADRAVLLDVSDLPQAAREQAERSTGFGISPRTQIVRFENVYVMKYDNQGTRKDKYEVPVEIFTAEAANGFIEPPQGVGDEDWRERIFNSGLRQSEYLLTVTLEGGMKFPRDLTAGGEDSPSIVAVRASQIGPLPLSGRIRENAKFLSIRELHRLLKRPELTRRIGRILRDFVERDQKESYLTLLADVASENVAPLRSADGIFEFRIGGVQRSWPDDKLVLTTELGGTIELKQTRALPDGQVETIRVSADRVTLSAEPISTPEGLKLLVMWSFPSADVTIGEETSTGRAFDRRAIIEMPDSLARLNDINPRAYLQTAVAEGRIADREAALLRGKLLDQSNSVLSEIHARLSFSLSCLLLPLAGGVLGMLFRSGNFLTAFAASVVPALIAIVLVVVGQQIAESVPSRVELDYANPLRTGIAIIWSGNVVLVLLTGALLWKLRR